MKLSRRSSAAGNGTLDVVKHLVFDTAVQLFGQAIRVKTAGGSPTMATLIVLGVLVLLGGGLGTVQIVKTVRMRKANELAVETARQAARKELTSRRESVLNALLRLDAKKADVDVAAVYESVSSGMAPARSAYFDAMAEANKAILGDTTNDRSDLPVQQYKQAQTSYEAARPHVERAQQAVAEINRIEEDLKKEMDNLPTTMQDENSKNKEAQALVAVLSQDGLPVPPDAKASIDSLDADLAAAKTAMSSMQVVLPALATLRSKRDEAVAAALATRAQADELANELSALTAAVHAIDLRTSDACLTQITVGYSEACWQGAPDVFAAAQAAKARAEETLAAAQESVKNHDWRGGSESVRAGVAAVAEFHTQAAKLNTILASLIQAPAKLKALRESAQRAIDAAWDYARANTDDDASHEEQIAKAEQVLASIATMSSKPDWLSAITLAEAAEAIAHQALTSCQSEVAQAEKDRIEARQQKEREAALRARLDYMRREWQAQAEAARRSSFWGGGLFRVN